MGDDDVLVAGLAYLTIFCMVFLRNSWRRPLPLVELLVDTGGGGVIEDLPTDVPKEGDILVLENITSVSSW